MIGTKLAHYEITSHIGSGGMGDVYRATDTKLGRSVAIKFLPEAFSHDSERVARFQREARVLASLNHPNIAAIHGVEEIDTRHFLVMELVPGETLSDRIHRGAIPLAEAIPIARQIADALEAAHEQGIIHRDLKPANVKVREDGTVKVLDFGLAKAIEPAGTTASASQSPTITSPAMTQSGTILGTAAYMSPEQAKGRAADKRSDVWSFGCVLYEMLTGNQLHQGKSTVEVLASIMKDEPQWDKVPHSVQKLLRKCLDKDPQDRPRHIGDVMLLVDDTPVAPTVTPSGPSFKKALLLTALGVIAGGVAMLAWTSIRTTPPGPKTTRFQIPLPENGDFGQYLSLSPDGRKLAFNTIGPEGGLWVRDLESLIPKLLPGTVNAQRPFWSPDSRFIAFSVGNQLKKIEVSGGPVETLCEAPNTVGSGAWNKDGVIIFGGAAGPVRKVSEIGGIATALTKGGEVQTLPSFLPDGRHFVYHRVAGSASGMYLGSIDAKPADQPNEMLLASQYAAFYVPSTDASEGHVFFVRDGTLMAQTFDAVQFKLTGAPVPVAEGVGTGISHGFFSVSANGVLAYSAGARAARLQLTWFDRQGRLLGRAGEPAAITEFVFSPDATRVATVRTAVKEDIWLLDVARSVATRFTFDQVLPGRSPVWSADGSRIIYRSGFPPLEALYEKPSNGSGEERLLRKSDATIPTSWSRDGRFLLYTTEAPTTANDIWILPMTGDTKPVPWLVTQFNEGGASFSPDMRWIAYLSNESGRAELYVRPFTPPGSGSSTAVGKWQISKDGAALGIPKWRADGKEIIFRAADAAMMAVEISVSGSDFQAGIPKRLFPGQPTNGPWDVTANGDRFLMALPPGQQEAQLREPITIVLNWQAMLNKK